VSVDRADVERIAALAHLRFDEREVVRLTDELNRILEHVEVLSSLTEEPSERPGSGTVGVPSTRDQDGGEADLLMFGPEALAPRWSDGFFVVPPPPGVHAKEDGS
jgi:aspartyl/glutamyl-tRNA(Asn/Gln) amidotransferase C subunit